MKVIPIFCCMLFLTLCSAKGQYGRYRLYPKLSDMIAEQGIAQTITTLDSILGIYFNSPYDTLTNEFVWYGNTNTYLFDSIAVGVWTDNSYIKLSTTYCTVFMRAYYWIWLISENMINTDSSPMYPSKYKWGTLHYKNGSIIYDYFISDESLRKYYKGIGVKYSYIYSNGYIGGRVPNFDDLGLKIIPSQYFREILPDIIEQYTQWIKVVKTEGLTVAREKKIALLPDGYTWKIVK